MSSRTGNPFQLADAFEWLARMSAETADLVITDPPYESLERHRAKGTTTRLKASKASSNQWFDVIRNDRLPELMELLYRVLRKNRHCYICCDQETLFHLKPAGELAGFTFWKPLVWNKIRIGMGYHYRNTYEFICFFEKGKRKLNDLGQSDVITVPRVNPKHCYPAEKPHEVAEVLVRQSTQPGELVIDPFMGSGSTARAALQLGRHFDGCDASQASLDHIWAQPWTQQVRRPMEGRPSMDPLPPGFDFEEFAAALTPPRTRGWADPGDTPNEPDVDHYVVCDY